MPGLIEKILGHLERINVIHLPSLVRPAIDLIQSGFGGQRACVSNHNDLYLCDAPSKACTIPKKMGKSSTVVATQHVDQYAISLLSDYRSLDHIGSAPSKTCFDAT